MYLYVCVRANGRNPSQNRRQLGYLEYQIPKPNLPRSNPFICLCQFTLRDYYKCAFE